MKRGKAFWGENTVKLVSSNDSMSPTLEINYGRFAVHSRVTGYKNGCMPVTEVFIQYAPFYNQSDPRELAAPTLDKLMLAILRFDTRIVVREL